MRWSLALLVVALAPRARAETPAAPNAASGTPVETPPATSSPAAAPAPADPPAPALPEPLPSDGSLLSLAPTHKTFLGLHGRFGLGVPMLLHLGFELLLGDYLSTGGDVLVPFPFGADAHARVFFADRQQDLRMFAQATLFAHMVSTSSGKWAQIPGAGVGLSYRTGAKRFLTVDVGAGYDELGWVTGASVIPMVHVATEYTSGIWE